MKIQKTYKTKYGRCAIIEKLNDDKILVEFLETGYRTVTTKSHLIRNEVKDYLSKSVFNVGYLGEDYPLIRKADKELCKKLRIRWKSMLSRCYNKKHCSYNIYGGSNVTVCSRWHCFCNFYNDVQTLSNWNRNDFLNGHISLDKDKCQQNTGNKIYSKDTCCWLTPLEQAKYTKKDNIRKKIEVTYPDGSTHEFLGIRTFSREHGLNEKNVSACVNGKRKTCKGYKFREI